MFILLEHMLLLAFVGVLPTVILHTGKSLLTYMLASISE